jgi:sigma-B regulation protein RsbQ
MDVVGRNHVIVAGEGARPIVFAHGYGCDQQMWRLVAPAFVSDHRVVTFDHVGCGRSDLSAFDLQRHGRLEGYAEDLIEILDQLDLHDAVLVGHSVSAMIALLAARQRPERVRALVMIGASPRYLNDPPEYHGGFEREDIDGLLDMIETNMVGWADFLAPLVMGHQAPAVLTEELKASFCALDPSIARRFAEVTFLADTRDELAASTHPCLLIQVTNDAIAPRPVGEYLRSRLPNSELTWVEGVGHSPHLTHPEACVAAIRAFLAKL